MILTDRGYLECVPARDLLREGQTETLAYFKDNRMYLLTRASLIGMDRIKLDGEIAEGSAQHRRAIRGTLQVAIADPIPIIRTDQEIQ